MARPIYVPQANGFITFKDDATDAEITAYLKARYPAPVAPAVPQAPKEQEVGPWESSGLGWLSRFQTAGGGIAELLGADDTAKYLYDKAQANLDEAAKYQPEEPSITGAETWSGSASALGDAAIQSAPDLAGGLGSAYVGGQIGAGIGGLGGPAAPVTVPVGATIGALVGGGLYAFGSLTGSNIQRQAQEQGKTLQEADEGTAMIAAAAQAPLEALADRILLGRLVPPGTPKNIVNKIVGDGVIKHAAKGAIAEGLTEPAQQAIEIAQANPEKLFSFSPEVQTELLDAAFAGGFLGGVVGGVATPLERMADYRRTAPQRQLKDDLDIEKRQNAVLQRTAEINRTAEDLRQYNVEGPVSISLEDVDGDSVYTIKAKSGNTFGSFYDPEDAKLAVASYQQRTGANVSVVEDVAAPTRTPDNKTIKKTIDAPASTPRGPLGGLKVIPFDTVSFDQKTRTKIESSGEAQVLDYGGRKIVIKNINGVDVPFYLSTGFGGKKDAASGKWYPFFGIGPTDGWINKTNGKEMSEYYGSPELRAAAQELDATIGDVRGDPSIPKAKLTGRHVNAINEGLDPADNNTSETLDKVRKNINDIVDRVRQNKAPDPVIPEESVIEEPIDQPVDEPIDDTFDEEAPVAEMPVEESRVLEEDAPPTETLPEAEPIRTELRPTATADQIIELQTDLFGAPKNVRDMTPEERATYEAERDRRYPPEEVPIYYDASPAPDARPRRLSELQPNPRAETPEYRKFMDTVYTGVESRVKSILPEGVGLDIKRSVADGAGYVYRGREKPIETPDGVKSVIELATEYFRADMTVEAMVKDLVGTLNHEVIHVLRTQGLLRPTEWRMLSRAAANTKVPGKKYTYLDKATAVYKPMGGIYSNPEEITEEAVAEMYKDWVAGNNNKEARPVGGLFNRITEFLRRIFRALKASRYEEVFKRIESGEMKTRERGPSREVDTRFSASPAAIQTPNGVEIVAFPKDQTSSSSVYLRRDYSPIQFKGKPNIAMLGAAFDRAFVKKFGRPYDINNPEDYKAIVNSMVDEVQHQMGQTQSGVGWYDGDIQDVFDELAKSFPILKDPYEGPAHQDMFTVIAGVMSNGMKAKANVELAAINFAHYLRTGEFSDIHPFTGKGWNQRSNIMGPQIKMLNSMISDERFAPRPGSNNPRLERMEKFLDFMFDEHSVREINQFRAKHGTKSPAKIGGVDTKRLGMYAFGPKFGPFILNLNGLTDETVDSWASRSFYRHMGRSLNASGKMNDAPLGPAHREAMKRALRDIADRTKLSSRDVQAVLWFYEKELYNQLGQRIPLEVFSDGAREFTRKYGTGASRPPQSRTDREREIAGSVETASALYDPTPERKPAGQRFSAAPVDGRDRPTLLADRKALLAEAKVLSDKGTLTGREAERLIKLGTDISDINYRLMSTKPLDPTKIRPEAERMSTLPVNVVISAYNDALKDYDVYMAINNAAMGTVNDSYTDVDRLYEGAKGPVMYDAFSDTREALRAAFGDTMRLYRAEGKQRQKPTQNWATTRQYAAQFGGNVVERDIPVDNVIAVNVGGGNYHEIIVGRPPQAGRFSASPLATPEDRTKALKESQWGRYFDGPFVDEELKNVTDPKSRSTIVAMSPDEFLRMATYGLRNPGQEAVYAENMDRGMKLAELPRLHIKTYNNGETIVTGHEGRHRAAAFKQIGMTKIPVLFRHDTYQWGNEYGNKPVPGSILTGQAPMENQMEMPDSVIFPLTDRGNSDLDELLQQGELLTNVSIGLAPAESSLEPNAREAIKQDSLYGGRKITKADMKELVPRFIPKGVTLATKSIEDAARKAGAARVYSSSAMGVYGGTAIEPSSALEAIIPAKDGYTVANAMAEETFRVAMAEKQSDAFVAVRLDPKEWSEPYARPGITLYFYPRASGPTARSLTEVKAIINSLPGADAIGGYTAIASQKATNSRLGVEEGYEAIRFIWVPEYAGVNPEDVVKNWGDTVEALNQIAEYAEKNRIASAEIDYYDLSLASKEDYNERIKEHRELRAGGNAKGLGRTGPWRRPVGESVAKRAGQEASRVAGSSLDLPGGVKRFSAAPLPAYIETRNDTLFAPAPKRSFFNTVTNFLFGSQPMNRTLRTIHGDIDISNWKMAGLMARTGVVDANAFVAELEKLANQKQGRGYQRDVADTSAIGALTMHGHVSHLGASVYMRGNLGTEYARAGDIQSATLKVVDDPDNMVNIIKILMQPGPVDSRTNEPGTMADVFKSYAAAQRAKNKKAAGIRTPNELDDQYINTIIPFTEREYPEVVEAYKMYQRFNRKLLGTAKEMGLMTQQTYDNLTRDMDYYGFYREVYESPLVPSISTKTASEFKLRPFKGSEFGGMVNDPIFVMLHNSQFWINAISRNLASQKTFKLARDMGVARILGSTEDPDPTRGEEEQVMFFRENGVQKRFAVSDPLLVAALGADSRPDIGRFWQVLGMPTQILRETVTRDPAFMIRNLLRDTLSAWVTSGADFTPIIGTIGGGIKAYKNSASYQALMGRGVVGSYDLAMMGPQELANKLRQRAMPSNVITVNGIEGGKAVVMGLWNRLGALSEYSDAATRIAVYEAAKKKGLSDAEAALQAVEILDFSRRGASHVLSIMTKMIPFLNARIQGLDVLYQAGKAGIRVATGTARGEAERNLGKKFLVRGGMIMAISLALEMLNEDNEAYDELDDYVKNSNLLVPLDVFGLKGQFLAYPKPFETGLIFSTIPQQMYKAARGDASMRDTIKLFTSEFASTFGVNPLPQFLMPWVEIKTNHDFYTGLPLISEGKARLSPELQYNSRTSQLAMMLGKIPIWYNFDTGRFEGQSPIIIDQLISGYFGPIGTYMAQGVGMAMEATEMGPERLPRNLSELPVVRSFYIDAETRNPKVVTQAYELFRIVDEANRSFSRLRQTGDAEATLDYLEENKDILSYKKYVFKLVDRLNKLSAHERAIERDKTMTDDEKREAMKRLREVRIRLASKVGEINEKLGR